MGAEKDNKVPLSVDAQRLESGNLTIECTDPAGGVRGEFEDVNPQETLAALVVRINGEVQPLPPGYTWKIVFPLPRPDRPPADVVLTELFRLPERSPSDPEEDGAIQ